MPGKLRTAVVAVSLLLASTGVFLIASPTYAASGCVGLANNYGDFNGYGSDTTNLDYGTQAYISTRSAALCTGSEPTTASEWAMLASENGTKTNPTQYMQAGYYHDRTTPYPVFFSEWNIGGKDKQYFDYGENPPAYGSTHLFTVQYNASLNVEESGYDFTALQSMVIPFGTGLWAQRQHQYFGEVHDDASDMYGTATAEVEFSSLAVQQPYHTCCQVVTQTLDPGDTNGWYYLGPVYDDGFLSHN